jgi:hypothetical protein
LSKKTHWPEIRAPQLRCVRFAAFAIETGEAAFDEAIVHAEDLDAAEFFAQLQRLVGQLEQIEKHLPGPTGERRYGNPNYRPSGTMVHMAMGLYFQR